jgi:hypothetical protein
MIVEEKALMARMPLKAKESGPLPRPRSWVEASEAYRFNRYVLYWIGVVMTSLWPEQEQTVIQLLNGRLPCDWARIRSILLEA